MTDFVVLAQGVSRDEFIAAVPAYFLCTTASLVAPRTPAKTAMFGVATMGDIRLPSDQPVQHTVVPVQKVQDAFPSMITIGRTANNDVVIHDIQVSKFHGFFRQADDKLELCDAGSRNGTWVAGVPLPPKGAPVRVNVGDEVRFGALTFVLLDSGAVWDLIRQH